eukprot:357108-Chlamydomonas_euryale.AAC.6
MNLIRRSLRNQAIGRQARGIKQLVAKLEESSNRSPSSRNQATVRRAPHTQFSPQCACHICHTQLTHVPHNAHTWPCGSRMTSVGMP